MILTMENMINIIQIIITLIIAIPTGGFALYQWYKANKVRRAEFINQIIEKLRFDKDFVEIVYLIEYNHDWYNGGFHNGADGLEFKIDKLLSYMTYICYLKNHRIISKNEFSILEYEIYRTCESPSIQAYLWNLHHFSNKRSQRCTFDGLIKYGKNKKIICIDFDNKNSTIFQKHLNF
ncbi:hypothetical protein [Fusibacter sp. 3D3]|uniref:hypothetical protein n=1 Tax=Fusibacter sp. 3D3 TaxID=1048380 RepID=UPI000853792A|nr:hypothetical protein [Fusibacter sp. 3D3]GAU78489.1 hypothetical protein F3D3_3123 [Fusibacter sp. 3D3]